MCVGNSKTNQHDKGEIGYHTISDFSLNWYIGLSMALISHFEFVKTSLYGITRQKLSKIKLNVKCHCMFAFFAQARTIITVNQSIIGKQRVRRTLCGRDLLILIKISEFNFIKSKLYEMLKHFTRIDLL